MKVKFASYILILAAAIFWGSREIGLAQIAFTAGVTVLVFSLAKVSERVAAMATGKDYVTEETEGESLRRRFRDLSDADKEDIAQIVWDRLFIWAGRSIVKKLWLIVLSCIVGLATWFGKDHIR